MLLDSVADSECECDDELELSWWELDRRAVQKVTTRGLKVRILLPRGVDFCHGLVLTSTSRELRVAVKVAACEVLSITPPDRLMGVLALELGNLHVPTEIVDGEVRVIADGPVEQVIKDLGVQAERRVVRFQPRRCAGTPQVRLSGSFRVVS